MLLVANSTPMVDFDSRLNSLRVNRERTALACVRDCERIKGGRRGCQDVRLLWSDFVSAVHGERSCRRAGRAQSSWEGTHLFPTPESPMRTTCAHDDVAHQLPVLVLQPSRRPAGVTRTHLEQVIVRTVSLWTAARVSRGVRGARGQQKGGGEGFEWDVDGQDGQAERSRVVVRTML